MTTLEYFYLLIRNRYLFTLIIIFSLLGGYIANLNLRPLEYQNIAYLTFNIDDNNDDSNAYYSIQAAEQVTESIQGWFLDPSFTSEVNQLSNLSFPIKANKQEKNNLLVIFNSNAQPEAKKYNEAILNVLNTRLKDFNNQADYKTYIANSYIYTENNGTKLNTFLAVSLILGFILALIISFLYEHLRAKVYNVEQIKKQFKKLNILTFVNSKQLNKDALYLDDSNESSTNLLTLDGQASINKNLSLQQIYLPNEMNKIEKGNKNILLIHCGNTNLLALKNIKHSKIEISSIVLLYT